MWLSGYSCRKRINISSTEPTPSGYQLKFRVGEGPDSSDYDFHLENKCASFPSTKNDSSDIVFTKSDGSTLLNAYIENVEGDAPNRTAIIWVKIDEDLSTNPTIYCYYNNPDESNPPSDPSQVFNYFDNFCVETTSNDSIDTDSSSSLYKAILKPKIFSCNSLYFSTSTANTFSHKTLLKPKTHSCNALHTELSPLRKSIIRPKTHSCNALYPSYYTEVTNEVTNNADINYNLIRTLNKENDPYSYKTVLRPKNYLYNTVYECSEYTSTTIDGTINSTEQRYEIDTKNDNSTVISPTSYQAQNTRVYATIRINSCYPEGGCIVLAVRSNKKNSYIAKIYAEKYTVNNTEYTTTKASPQIIEYNLKTTLAIFSDHQFNLLQTPPENLYLPNNTTYKVSLGAYNDSLHLFIDDQEIANVDQNIQQISGNIGAGIEEGQGWIEEIYATEFVYPEPTFSVGVEENNTSTINEIVEIEDTLTVDKSVSIIETLEIEDFIDYFAYVKNVIESSYILKGWHRSPYAILTSKITETKYNIYVSSKNTSLYSIRLCSNNISSYILHVHKSTSASYIINVDKKETSKYAITTKQNNESAYRINFKVRYESSYFIEEIIKVRKEVKSPYKIIDYLALLVENESAYEISLEGLTVVNEKLVEISEPCLLYYDEKNIHLHLYNTNIDERNVCTVSYAACVSNRHTYIERELIKTEKQIELKYYYVEATDREASYSSFKIQTDERTSSATSYASFISNRNIEVRNRDTLELERQIYTISLYSDARNAYVKSWHITERFFTAYGIPYTPVADQRLGWAQVHITKYTVIRQCYTEACSLSLSYIINPQWNNIFTKENTDALWQVLFENEQVTPYVNEYSQIPIPLLYKGFDLILINERDKNVYNLADTGACFIPVHQITTNTYEFKGYLVPRHVPLYIRMYFMFAENEDFSDPNEYYKYLVRHGYINVKVDGEEISDGEAQVKCISPMTLIPLHINVLDELVHKFRIEIVWGYPYQALNKSKVLCVFYSI